MSKRSGQVEITRQGNGRHKAGRAYDLRVDGKYVGTYETRAQAQAAAAERTR